MAITPRQHELARLVAAGHPRAHVAARLGIVPNTVYNVERRLRAKLGIGPSRIELAQALQQCQVREWNGGGRPARHGLKRGDCVRISGGRFAGRTGVYIRSCNGRQVLIQIGGGAFALQIRYVERFAQVAQ